MKNINILFTSVGNLAFPLVKESLKNKNNTKYKFKIVGCDIREDAHGLYFCDKSYLVDKRSSKDFIDEIIYIIKKEKIKLIFPLSTEDQDFFSKRKNFFESYNVKIIASPYNAVKIANNKKELYEFCNKKHINHPNFFLLTYRELEEKGLNYIKTKIEKQFNNIFVVKPIQGKGGSNLYIVADKISKLREDDRKFYLNKKIFFDKINNFVVYDKTLITEYLNGDEYSVDILSNEGNFIYGVVRKRYKSTGGLALIAEVVNNKEVLELAKKIVKSLKLSYINNIQIKYSVNSDKKIPKIMEINPRIPGTLSLSVNASKNFILDAVKISLNEKIRKPKKIKYGLKIIRFYSGIIVENNYKLISLKKEE